MYPTGFLYIYLLYNYVDYEWLQALSLSADSTNVQSCRLVILSSGTGWLAATWLGSPLCLPQYSDWHLPPWLCCWIYQGQLSWTTYVHVYYVIHILIFFPSLSLSLSHTHTHTHTHKRAHTHTHTHAHTCTHTLVTASNSISLIIIIIIMFLDCFWNDNILAFSLLMSFFAYYN